MTESWIYEKKHPNGGASGSSYLNAFNGSKKNLSHSAAREAVQNSVDAASKKENEVQIEFKFKRLTGKEYKDFFSFSGLTELKKKREKILTNKNNAFFNEEDRLNLLYISDSSTTGLCGNPESHDTKLRKLLMELADEEKFLTGGDELGGSYGFGKAVYGGSSNVATIFVYSRTNTDYSGGFKGKDISIFMGCAYHNVHTIGRIKKTGRGFFGIEKKIENEGSRYDPFIDKQADELAKKFGMERDPQDYGTTILIVDCKLNPEELCAGVEESWWPRLESGLLDIEIIDFEGKSLPIKPKSRKHLAPFVQAFGVARNISPQISGKSQQKDIKLKNDGKTVTVGTVGLQVIDEELDSDIDSNSDYRDQIALMRSPLMVVEYFAKRSFGTPPVAGVFIAAKDYNKMLKASEPLEHDRWAEHANRLEQGQGEIIRKLLDNSWAALKSFQVSARPAEDPSQKRMTHLERSLSQWFGNTGKSQRKGPDQPKTPVTIQRHVAIVEEENFYRIEGFLSLGLKSDYEEDFLDVEVKLVCAIVDEDKVSKIDPIPINIEDAPDIKKLENNLVAYLSKGSKTKISFKSERYDPGWTVKFIPEVSSMSEDSK